MAKFEDTALGRPSYRPTLESCETSGTVTAGSVKDVTPMVDPDRRPDHTHEHTESTSLPQWRMYRGICCRTVPA